MCKQQKLKTLKQESLNTRMTMITTIEQIQSLYHKEKQREQPVQTMLGMKDFIEHIQFPLSNVLPFTLMCQVFEKPTTRIYLTDELIRAFGYKGELKKQKDSILYLVKKYKIPIISLTNEKYKAFLNKDNNKNEYPPITNRQLKAKPKHILIYPRDFKRILLVVNTSKGDSIRKYYIEIEELFLQYFAYQADFYRKNTTEELRKLYDLPHLQLYNKQNKIAELDKELEERLRVGVIYFITDGEYTKIGYTYSLIVRLRELQVANARFLTVHSYYFTQYPQEEEKRIHQTYRERHVQGEWFRGLIEHNQEKSENRF